MSAGLCILERRSQPLFRHCFHAKSVASTLEALDVAGRAPKDQRELHQQDSAPNAGANQEPEEDNVDKSFACR